MIKKYSDFLESVQYIINEFNKQDKDLIGKLDDYFTVAIEYEICSTEHPDEEPIANESEAVKNAIEQTMLDLKRGKTVGAYGFNKDRIISEEWFKDNEKTMINDNDDFYTLSFKKKRTLHKKYKTWTWLQEFFEELENLIDFDDQEETSEALHVDNFEDELERSIVARFGYNIILFGFIQNIDYLKEKVAEHLPNFWNKWNHIFKFELEGDVDKQRIIEFSPKTYMTGISQGVEQLQDFYNDFEKQSYWYFNNRTALHLNIGVTAKVDWNPIKGLLLMGDYDRELKGQSGRAPYVFNKIEWRYGNRFTGSIIDAIKKNLKGEITYKYSDVESKEIKVGDFESDKIQTQIDKLSIEMGKLSDEDEIQVVQDKIDKLNPIVWNYNIRNKEEISKHRDSLIQNKDLLDLKDIKGFEKYFNEFLVKANNDFYIKEFGIKLTELHNNYVEFRYVGTTITDDLLGGVSKDMMMDKMYYFCYVVYAMTNDDYKKREYHKKLFKLVSELKTYIS